MPAFHGFFSLARAIEFCEVADEIASGILNWGCPPHGIAACHIFEIGGSGTSPADRGITTNALDGFRGIARPVGMSTVRVRRRNASPVSDLIHSQPSRSGRWATSCRIKLRSSLIE